MSIGDTFELPGAAVSSVTFGAGSLTITTGAGTTAFTSIVYNPNSPIAGYTTALDPISGLRRSPLPALKNSI